MNLLTGARALDRLFQLEKKHGAILEAQAAEIQGIKDRLTRLEEHVKAREEIVVSEAKSAAAAVGSSVASQHVSDISRRLGAMEERLRNFPRLPPSKNNEPPPRLPPPDDNED